MILAWSMWLGPQKAVFLACLEIPADLSRSLTSPGGSLHPPDFGTHSTIQDMGKCLQTISFQLRRKGENNNHKYIIKISSLDHTCFTSMYLFDIIFNTVYEGKAPQRQKCQRSTKVIILPCSAEHQP